MRPLPSSVRTKLLTLVDVPNTISGALLSQHLLGPMSEHTVFTALILLQSGSAFIIQLLNVGSAAVFFLSALPIFIAVLLNPLFSGNANEIALVTYALGQVFPLFGGVLLLLPVVEVFVPLVWLHLVSYVM